MANDPKAPPKPGATPPKSWEEELYTPERIQQWIRGEINMAQLDGFAPKDLIEFAEMGYAQYQNGKFDEARVIFTGLIALDGKEPYYRTALGCVFMAQELLDRAVEMFTEALTLNPVDLSALVNRGEALLRQGHVVEAATDFKTAVINDPKNESPFSGRAKALAAAALETLEEAMKESGSEESESPQKSKVEAPKGQAKPKKK